MEIRKAKLEDRKQILKLVKKFYSRNSPQTVKEWKRGYKKLIKLTFVAEIRRKIVGYVACSFERDAIYVGDLYVLPKYRRKDVATSLLKKIEKVRKKLKKKYLRADIRKKDKPALAFYKKFSFKIWKPKSKSSLKLRK